MIVHDVQELRCIKTRYSIAVDPEKPDGPHDSPPIPPGFARESLRVRGKGDGTAEVAALDVERPFSPA